MKTYWTTTNNIKRIYRITLENTSITAVSRSLRLYALAFDGMHAIVHTCKSPKKWNILIPFTIPPQHSILIMEMFLFARLLQSPWRVDGEAFVQLRIEDEPAQRGKRVTEEILIIPWNSILINFLVVQQTSALDRQQSRDKSFPRFETNGKTYYI